jgi:uncharacterized protein YbjT (DUF2867 family)
MRILVTGGSGVLGSQVVARLRAADQQPVILSRRASPAPDWVQGDIATGEGLPEALAGVEVRTLRVGGGGIQQDQRHRHRRHPPAG